MAVHDSIQEAFRRISTLSDHFGPWKKALDDYSYYRETERKIGLEAEEFVVGVLNKKKGLIDSSLIFRFCKLAKKHDPDIFLSLCREQVDNLYKTKALSLGIKKPITGAISYTQRFDSGANLNPHIHALWLDGVLTEIEGNLKFQM